LKGKLFIIAGPSGSGKDTIIDAMCQKIPALKKAISYTDREKRLDDKADSYHFISKEIFDELVKSGEVFEWEYARDERRYGSSKKEVMGHLAEGHNLIKIVGPKSFKNIKNIFGKQTTGIFIKYEGINLLKERIKKNRPDITERDLEVRFKQAFEDMGYEKDYDYSVINPEDHPEKAIGEVERIIQNELKG